MAIDRASIQAERKRIADEVAATPGVLSTLYANKNFRLVGFNVDLIGRAILLRGMIAQRVDHDTQAAMAAFREAAQLTEKFDKALKAIGSGSPPFVSTDLDIDSFEISLFECILAGMWTRARQVALLHQRAIDVIDRLRSSSLGLRKYSSAATRLGTQHRKEIDRYDTHHRAGPEAA